MPRGANSTDCRAGVGLNIAPRGDRSSRGRCAAQSPGPAMIGKRGETRDFSYSDLRTLTNCLANVLRRLAPSKGERVFLLAGRIPELYISALGTLKNGNVFCPLFSAFRPEPIRQRISIGDGRVLVTTVALYRRKVADLRSSLPGLKHVLLIGSPEKNHKIPNTEDFYQLMDEASDDFEIPPTDPEDLALLHFTSGTTGKPKGAMHVHQAVVAHHVTGRFALDFHPDDIFWCTADPGWITGTSYGIIAPLTNGITSIIDEAEFDAERWYTLLQEQKVTNWYTAPTAVRMMMKIGTEVIRRIRSSPSALYRQCGRAAESRSGDMGTASVRPSNSRQLVADGNRRHYDFELRRDGYSAGLDGAPASGIEAGIVRRLEDGGIEEIREAGVEGELAFRPGWPSMFRGYLNEEERYRKCFAGGWYLTGDLTRRDSDGYFWFVGRADDVIKSSGSSDRAVRSRKHPDGASCRRGGWCHWQTGPDGR